MRQTALILEHVHPDDKEAALARCREYSEQPLWRRHTVFLRAAELDGDRVTRWEIVAYSRRQRPGKMKNKFYSIPT